MLKVMVLKISKSKSLILLACLFVQIGFGGVMAGDSFEENIDLLLETKNSSVSSSDTLEYLVKLTNNGKEPLSFSVTNSQTPFTAALWDEKGKDWLENKFISRRKDRSTPEIKISIPVGSNKIYRSTIKLSDIPGLNSPKKTRQLKLAITFPLVRYLDQQYKVTLIRSNEIAIAVK